MRSADAVRVSTADDQPVAFATLSRNEADLPPGSVELCHLIVRPDMRRQYRGSHLVLALTHAARQLGYDRLFGRVVPSNAVAHPLLTSLRWGVLANRETPASTFVWYSKTIR